VPGVTLCRDCQGLAERRGVVHARA
jgi:hypothetical protein